MSAFDFTFLRYCFGIVGVSDVTHDKSQAEKSRSAENLNQSPSEYKSEVLVIKTMRSL